MTKVYVVDCSIVNGVEYGEPGYRDYDAILAVYSSKNMADALAKAISNAKSADAVRCVFKEHNIEPGWNIRDNLDWLAEGGDIGAFAIEFELR